MPPGGGLPTPGQATAADGSAVLVIGAGLAGALLALALRERQRPVLLLDSARDPSATSLSYGVVPGFPLAANPLARLAAQAPQRWRQLERLHGPLGWHPARWRLPLPVSQVDGEQFQQRLPAVLAAAGVESRRGEARALWRDADGWRVELAQGAPLAAPQVVLAAGSGCRTLWPALPPRLASSWAGVLQLPARPSPLQPDQLLLPLQFRRLELERRFEALEAEAWVVDAGAVPRGSGALLGQITLVRPPARSGEPALDPEPEAAAMERRLRQALVSLDLDWRERPARYRQAQVSFCSDGMPLAGPVPDAPGLWVFCGFSGGFAQVPVLAPLLALALEPGAARPEADRAWAARRRLRQLGVWGEPSGGG